MVHNGRHLKGQWSNAVNDLQMTSNITLKKNTFHSNTIYKKQIND